MPPGICMDYEVQFSETRKATVQLSRAIRLQKYNTNKRLKRRAELEALGSSFQYSSEVAPQKSSIISWWQRGTGFSTLIISSTPSLWPPLLRVLLLGIHFHAFSWAASPGLRLNLLLRLTSLPLLSYVALSLTHPRAATRFCFPYTFLHPTLSLPISLVLVLITNFSLFSRNSRSRPAFSRQRRLEHPAILQLSLPTQPSLHSGNKYNWIKEVWVWSMERFSTLQRYVAVPKWHMPIILVLHIDYNLYSIRRIISVN